MKYLVARKRCCGSVYAAGALSDMDDDDIAEFKRDNAASLVVEEEHHPHGPVLRACSCRNAETPFERIERPVFVDEYGNEMYGVTHWREIDLPETEGGKE